ncbi:MAG: saccharopine dehydrogenase NADP-binding domain-containing protein [Anaerolineae bacterium]|nr:saccharopine dehydrogenase NADP-binding domain-containing protein [Anaerolineae bacterium]MDW8102699.1 saccharopine dehydrogenase NADP-binding domain-containing protein [Anaerolineae bacterium]
MKIVVLGGCGDMGSHVVHDLLQTSDAEVVIADYRIKLAEEMASKLGGKARAAFVDATSPTSLRKVLEGADAAVGCIGPFYKFALPLAKAALEAKVNYVDICDDYGPVEEILAMDEAARQAGITIITGLGWTPGITNILARRASEQLDEVDEIHIAWAGSPSDSKGLAVIMHVFYVSTGEVPTWSDGRLIRVKASSGRETVEFPPPLGKVKVFHCGHPEPITIPRYIKARNVSLKGALVPEWNNKLLNIFSAFGLINTPARRERIARLIHPIEGLFRAGGIPCSGARVTVKGRKDGQARTISYAVADRMGRLTGIPASIGAQWLARGLIQQKGAFAPEGCIEPEPFLEELAKRGIKVVEM